MRKTALLIVLLLAAGAAQAKPAQFFRGAANARPYTGSEFLASVQAWRDRGCKSTFDLSYDGERRPVRWEIDWKKVINARVSTRTSFSEDVLADHYQKQRGIVVAGRGAFMSVRADGTAHAIDNFEFFLADQGKVEALVADLEKTHRDCG